jgi:hypothetical protein
MALSWLIVAFAQLRVTGEVADGLDPSGEITPAADLICQPCVSSDAYLSRPSCPTPSYGRLVNCARARE